MLADLVASLVVLGQKTTAVQFHQHDECPTKLWVQYGDKLDAIDAPPPMRQHTLYGLDDLVAVLTDMTMAPAPEVYVDGAGVIALLDRAERRQTVCVRLQETSRWAKCVELQKPRSMQPKDAVKMLRMELHGGNVAHVIQALSRIEFTRTGTGRTDIAHGKESLGRSVEAAVQQAKDVPEQFTLAVPIWSNSGFNRFSVNVEFGLYLDLEAQTVELRVLPDEIERCRNLALAAAVAELGARLEGVPIFLGAP